jgi:hypothetical protein
MDVVMHCAEDDDEEDFYFTRSNLFACNTQPPGYQNQQLFPTFIFYDFFWYHSRVFVTLLPS